VVSVNDAEGRHDVSFFGLPIATKSQLVIREQRRTLRKTLILVLGSLFLHSWFGLSLWAEVGGSITGTVKDESAALVPDAVVKATNIDTSIDRQVATTGRGFYSLPNLPVGRYNLTIAKAGFRPYQRSGIAVDTNSSVVVDAVLQIGGQAQAVTVNEAAVRVETSETQIGEVIGGAKMTVVPLNGRSYTDLLALQPGVVPATSLTSNTQQDVGVSALSPSGDLNPGTISINGQREFSNAFIVNGSDAEEDVNSAASIIPNLDSIAEFRVLTNNVDISLPGHSTWITTLATASLTAILLSLARMLWALREAPNAGSSLALEWPTVIWPF